MMSLFFVFPTIDIDPIGKPFRVIQGSVVTVG
jgi:hypothetical protein